MNTPTKKPWESKTFWAVIITLGVTAYNALAPQQHWPLVPQEWYAVLAALGLWGVRTADTTISTQPYVAAPDNVVPATGTMEDIR